MPGMNGLELFRETRQLYPNLTTIFHDGLFSRRIDPAGQNGGNQSHSGQTIGYPFPVDAVKIS